MELLDKIKTHTKLSDTICTTSNGVITKKQTNYN